jgi:hypothetical protein
MYCPPGREGLWTLFPAHPRFTRMYGVTHSIAFQAILYIQNINQLGQAPHLPKKHIFLSFFDNFSAKIFGDSEIIITFAPKLIIVKQ